MIIYIAVLALAFIGFAINEFAVNRDLRPSTPQKTKIAKAPRFASLRTRFAPIAAGTRLPTNTPSTSNPLSLTRHLGTHA